MTTQRLNLLRDFNLNSILVLVATAAVGWLVTNGLGSLKDTRAATIETAKSVARIETALPFVSQQMGDLKIQANGMQTDLKDIRSNYVTREELNTKHQMLQNSIQEVKNSQSILQEQLKPKR